MLRERRYADTPIRRHVSLSPSRPHVSPSVLDQFDFVAFRRIDERDDTSAARLGGTVGERVSLRRSVFREGFEIFHFEREVRDVRAHVDRTALIEFADLDFLVAARRFEENEL
jgi:hypothetical protein